MQFSRMCAEGIVILEISVEAVYAWHRERLDTGDSHLSNALKKSFTPNLLAPSCQAISLPERESA